MRRETAHLGWEVAPAYVYTHPGLTSNTNVLFLAIQLKWITSGKENGGISPFGCDQMKLILVCPNQHRSEMMNLLESAQTPLLIILGILLAVHFALYLSSRASNRVFRWLSFFEAVVFVAWFFSVFGKVLIAAKN